jgi:hypothetical protein
MADITMIGTEIGHGGVQFLADVTITNQTANSTAVTRGLRVPNWAVKAVFYIWYDSSAGSSPLFDFTLGQADWYSDVLLGAPSDATDVTSIGNAAWNGITQVTGTGAYVIAVEVGPDVTDDDTGSATASCCYGVKAELPPVLTYTYTTDGSTDDEDYRFRIAVHWKA